MAKGKSISPDKAPALPYAAPEAERTAVERYNARKAAQPPRPRLKVKNGDSGRVTISVDHPDAAVAEALFGQSFGVTGFGASQLLSEALAALCVIEGGAVSQSLLDKYIGLVQELEPRDATEAMLASQMASVHFLAMSTAARLHGNLSPEARDRYMNQLAKLNRTFVAEIEALKRYRTKGEQRVIVEHQHVHVHPGGQAVVGTVNQGVGGGASEKDGQSHVRSIPECPAVHGDIEALGSEVPGAGADREDRVSVPRRQSRGSLRAV